jgi:hypothetical protein
VQVDGRQACLTITSNHALCPLREYPSGIIEYTIAIDVNTGYALVKELVCMGKIGQWFLLEIG